MLASFAAAWFLVVFSHHILPQIKTPLSRSGAKHMPQNINCIYNKLNDADGGKSLNIGKFIPSREKQYSLV
jgi:hypothetical protein